MLVKDFSPGIHNEIHPRLIIKRLEGLKLRLFLYLEQKHVEVEHAVSALKGDSSMAPALLNTFPGEMSGRSLQPPRGHRAQAKFLHAQTYCCIFSQCRHID